MVFESLVVDLVNKYLGAYVENLDPSQLSIGIWGGDVVLENLHVKGDALKDLDLPVQIKAGFIGKLTLKIPWKNLYKAPVEATLNGLYILAMPNESVKYDQKKEDESAQAIKQAQLQAIEEQLLKKSESKAEEKKDGFVEKLSTQIIKNLQIDIQNIHIRYEDESTIKNKPFAFGITLSRLSLQTTNEDWIPCILDESVKVIYKMVNLSALSVYWNSNPSKMIWKCSREEQIEHFRATIMEEHFTPKDMTYIIKPISLSAKLRLNPKPMSDLENPKIVLGVLLNQIGLCLSHKQYHSIMQLVESMDRMSVNQPYRKFKPSDGVLNNAKAWWKYAYNSMVQSEVKRKIELFSWKHIREHRNKLKQYKAMYQEKLVQKNPPKEIVEKLIKMENDIDVFNITLMRQMAETELVKKGEVIKSKKSRHQKEEKSGWFGGWFGGGSKAEKPKDPALTQAFDESEKKLLYEAIDYSAGESAADENFPIEYVATNVDLNLQKISLELVDNRSSIDVTLINLEASNIETKFKQRPSANAIGLTTTMKVFEINGLQQGDLTPHLISSNINADTVETNGKLLDILFETNPLDGSCDQNICLGSQPLQITYDACTINTLLDFVKPPKDLSFQQLKTVAASAYEDVKEQTATGLKHAMKSRKVMNVDINLMSSYVVVPHGGLYKPGCAALVVDLGEVNLKSIRGDVKDKSSTDIAHIRSQAYDKFKIDVKNIQILLSNENDDWGTGRTLSSSPMHILEPLNISVLLEKCIIVNDAALPKLKVSGELPLVSLRITDAKISNAIKLGESIPLPVADETPATETFEYIPLEASQSVRKTDLKFVSNTFDDRYGSSGSVASSANISSADEEFFTADSDFSDTDDHLLKAMQKKKLKQESAGLTQLTDVAASFVIDKILIVIGEHIDKKDHDILSLSIENFGVLASVRTWDTTVNAFLGAIALQYLPLMSFDGSPLYVVRTPLDVEKKLLTICVIMAKKNCPDFAEVYNNTEQRIEVRFRALEVNIYYKALKAMRALSLKLIPKSDDKPVTEELATAAPLEITPTESNSFATAQGSSSSQSTQSKKKVAKRDIVNVHLVAVLESFIINLQDTNSQLASIAIQGIETNIKVKSESTSILLKLQNLVVIDFHPNTLFQEIVTAVEGDVLTADITVFNDNTLGEDYKDMNLVDTSVKVRLGAMKIVFLKRFVDALVAYSSQFQDAKAMAEQAGALAQEAAVTRAKKLAERNPRILLDVLVTVPSIVIPQNSNSLQVMAADLGNVKIQNSFEIVGAADTDIPAVSDNMSVDILDVKLSLCTLNDAKVATSEHQILEPMCLNITLKRNLAATWFHDIPDVSIGGKMQAINVKFSSYDVAGMLQILDQNMNESPTSAQLPSSSESIVIKVVKEPEDVKISSAVSATSTLKDETLSAKSVSSVWDTLKINFVMESIRVNMYTDNLREFPLAKFFVDSLALTMDQRSDTSQDIAASLADILLEDLRITHKDRLTRYIERKSNSLSNHVLNAHVNKLSDGAMNIKAHLSSLSIILCVEFLVKVANLFAHAFAKPEDGVEEHVTTKKTTAVEVANESGSREADTEVNTAIHVEFVLHRPDIILVTDLQSETAESIVMGLKLELIFNTTAESSTKRLACKLSELQINSCPFNEIINLAIDDLIEHKKVLAPCDFDINGIMSDEKQEFFIDISKIRIIASPIIINTITEATAMLATVSSSETSITDVATVIQAPNIEINFNLKNKKYWFIDQADDILKSDKTKAGKLLKKVKRLSFSETKTKMIENMRLSVPDIRIQLEAGEGHHSVPLLITQLGIHAEVKDWSGGEMLAKASLSLGVVYFNEGLSVWEPLVEPVETNPGFSNSKYKLWELNAEVKQNKPVLEEVNVEDLPSLMEVNVTSSNLLHTTITHATIKTLNGLSKAFADAAVAKSLKEVSPTKRVHIDEVSAGIKIKNVLGRELNITIGKGLSVLTGAQKLSDLEYVLKNGKTLFADFTRQEFADIWALIENQSMTALNSNNLVHVRLPGQEDYGIFDVSKTGLKYHSLSDGKRSISIISNVESKRGVRTVTLQSCLGIYNHLLDKLEVVNEHNTIVGMIEPEKHFPIPNSFVEDGSKLFLRPIGDQISVSKSQVQVDKKSFNEVLRFSAASKTALPMYVNVQTTSQDITHDSGSVSGTLTKITCKPSVVLKNFLPFEIKYTGLGVGLIKNQRILTSGTSTQIYDAEMERSKIQVTLEDYRGSDWVGAVSVTTGLVELSDWQFENTKVKGKFMTLGKHVSYSEGFMVVTLYSPYWMVNETAQTLEYKGGDDNIVVHPSEKSDFILFAYNSKSFLSKNSLLLRVNKSNYSDAFSIDAVGSSGTMICKDKGFNYMIGTSISLTSFGFTKVVTFSNYFTLSNLSSFDLEICEASAKTFVGIQSNAKIKFWPESHDACIKVRIKNEPATISAEFGFRKLDSGVLLKFGGTDNYIFADVTVTEFSVTVSFKNYYAGSSAVLVVNHTAASKIPLSQSKTTSEKVVVMPSQVMHYIWPVPSKKRMLTWQVDNEKENTIDVFQEDAGTVKIKGRPTVHWVLFIDGMQRVLIFTENETVSQVVQQGLSTERSNMDISISLHGMSLSIADTKLQREIMYFAITSSGIIWEEKPKKRWKALPLKYASSLEQGYQKMNSGNNRASASLQIVKHDSHEFDLANMREIKPNKAEIRRFFSPGIWCQYTVSNHQTLLHVKVNKIQIDNQLQAAVFPVVLHPIPLPKTVAVDSSPKPFVELSIMTRKSEHQSFTHIKYYKVLVQEFSIKLDMGFISALLPVFGADQIKNTPEKEMTYFKTDIAHVENRTDDTNLAQNTVITFYDNLHLSPIKVHVSFSMQNNCFDDQQKTSIVELPFNAFTAILQSVGVTLSDIDDVVFKLGYFERFYQFFSQQQFTSSVSMHYAGQAIKQMYVLVLGLDVIGNPYGLVMGIAEGVTDMFYEPYQGMIQGPGEFVEGLALGARSLLGHTVGGAAGAVSRVTGALGKGIATMTMDDDYKKKRQMEKNKQPADLKEGLARGGKGLVMGVVGGLTGVITKPVEGAQKEGAAGFFKGVGKGLIGVVARPASGVIDLASNTFEGIQSLADMSEEVKRMRPARSFDRKAGILHPYSLKKAQGNAMLQEVEKGAYMIDQYYVNHAPLNKNKKSFVILTDKIILEAHTGEIFGQWTSAWAHEYAAIIEEPHMVADGIKLVTEKQKHKLFGKSSNGMTISFHDDDLAKQILEEMRKSWNDVPKLQRTNSVKKEKKSGIGLSFKKHSKK